jgi:hypothetical protein
MTGRNDPCPCGSGKKFKKCCLGKEESLPSCGGATTASAELRKALEGRQFNSLEEVQALAEQHMQQRNRHSLLVNLVNPVDERCSWSADTMIHAGDHDKPHIFRGRGIAIDDFLIVPDCTQWCERHIPPAIE